MTEYSGKTSSYHHKWNDTENPDDVNKAVRKVWFLDAQWSDCPIEVEDEVKKLWSDYDLGNDNYILKYSHKWHGLDYPIIAQYIKEQIPNLPDDEEVIIHWWW